MFHHLTFSKRSPCLEDAEELSLTVIAPDLGDAQAGPIMEPPELDPLVPSVNETNARDLDPTVPSVNEDAEAESNVEPRDVDPIIPENNENEGKSSTIFVQSE